MAGRALKWSANLLGTPFQASASAGGVFLWMMFGHCAANYLTPEHLIAEAASDTSASPAELSWLLWEQRPPVRWAADGKPVPDSVIRWLVKQASRSNTPIPDAGLRHHVGLLDRADRAGLGDFLLDGWIMAAEFAISSSVGSAWAVPLTSSSWVVLPPSKRVSKPCSPMLSRLSRSSVVAKSTLSRAAAARRVQRTRVEHVAGGELRHGPNQAPSRGIAEVLDLLAHRDVEPPEGRHPASGNAHCCSFDGALDGSGASAPGERRTEATR